MAYISFQIRAKLSYPVLAEPKSYMNDPNKPKEYSCDLLIPKSDTAMYQIVENARKQAVKETWTYHDDADFERTYALIIRGMGNKKGFFDGDVKAQNNPKQADVYGGHWYLKATNLQQPTLVNRQGKPTDANSFYAGCVVQALLSVGGYENSGKGLRNTLRGLQFYSDGTRWSGNVTASVNEFENLDNPNESIKFDVMEEADAW